MTAPARDDNPHHAGDSAPVFVDTPEELALRHAGINNANGSTATASVPESESRYLAALRVRAESAERDVKRLREEANDYKIGKDAAYTERNQLVAALASLFPSSLERHPEEDKEWEDDWRWVVYIDLPTGQVSWHLHDSHLALFAKVSRFQGRKWDGHTTEEKYRRLAVLGEIPAAPALGQHHDAAVSELAARIVDKWCLHELVTGVPQTFGEAVKQYGERVINCEPHEWDNRKVAENVLWLIDRLYEMQRAAALVRASAPTPAGGEPTHAGDGWVSVKDRLPDTGRYVLTQDENGGLDIDAYEFGKWWEASSWRLNVIAWRELPPKYAPSSISRLPTAGPSGNTKEGA